jgi:hypothetical protein
MTSRQHFATLMTVSFKIYLERFGMNAALHPGFYQVEGLLRCCCLQWDFLVFVVAVLASR